MNKNQIYNELVRCEDDLSDDNMEINTINLGVESLITNFGNGVKSDNTGDITAKIANLREELQRSDTNISSAVTYVQYEMKAVQWEIEQEAAAKRQQQLNCLST